MKFDEVNQGLASGAFILVDVRNVDELKSNGKIPGSVNMPRLKAALSLSDEEFSKRFGVKKFDKKQALVISCHKGGRAVIAESIFKAQGYKNVQVYHGSFQDWTSKGGKIDRI